MTTFEHMAEHDDDAGPPWYREDGHGEVSEWTSREKKAGELVLNSDGGSRRYYDYAGSVKLARRDGWGIANPPEGATRRQIAALAAREDFERLRQWCSDDWCYVGIVVTVSVRGVDLGTASLWGIESDAMEEARKRIAEINAMLEG